MQATPSPIKALKYKAIIVMTRQPPKVLMKRRRMMERRREAKREINDICQVDFKSLMTLS